jgi:hypothetical protein
MSKRQKGKKGQRDKETERNRKTKKNQEDRKAERGREIKSCIITQRQRNIKILREADFRKKFFIYFLQNHFQLEFVFSRHFLKLWKWFVVQDGVEQVPVVRQDGHDLIAAVVQPQQHDLGRSQKVRLG